MLKPKQCHFFKSDVFYLSKVPLLTLNFLLFSKEQHYCYFKDKHKTLLLDYLNNKSPMLPSDSAPIKKISYSGWNMSPP